MMKRVVLFALTAASVSILAAGKPDWVAKVKRGEVKEAKASWWGFDPTDATDALQAAIRSKVPKLIVDKMDSPWIVRPLFAVSNQEIVFEEGVEVVAKKGEFKGGNDSLLTLREVHDVTLTGYGATLRMQRADYDNPKLYRKAEWRMVLNILSSRNIKVLGLTLAESGGDGIYLGVSKAGVPPENIVIRDVICDRNYRQGISVIAARNLLIENTIMRDTKGTPPAAGIDFEPNHPSEELVNCVMRNCICENNAGCGYAFYLPNLHADSAPLSIRLENCVSRRGNSTDFALLTGNSATKAVSGLVELVNCRFDHARGQAISIRNKPAAGALLRFRDCIVDSPALDRADMPPISLTSQSGIRRSIGGVDFGNFLVIDPVKRPFFEYFDWLGGMGAETVRGTFTVRRGGKETVTRITPEWMKKTFPPRVTKFIPVMSVKGAALTAARAEPSGANIVKRTTPFYLRGESRLLLHAEKGKRVSLTLAHAQVGKYSGKTLDITVRTPGGKSLVLGKLPFKTTRTLTFQAPETGIYRLHLQAGANKVGVMPDSYPVAVSAEEGAVHFIGAAGNLFFLVPAGTKQFSIVVYGEGRGEAIDAAIFDPSGKKIWAKQAITLPDQCAPDMTAPSRDEVWRLQLQRPKTITCEDNYVDVRGIPPFLASDPDGLLNVRRK